jgi:hypothetical protein
MGYFVGNQGASLTIELFWSVIAAVVYFIATISIAPRWGWRMRWPVVAGTLLSAVAYSWVRWVPHFASLELSEAVDFFLAMGLAASGGLATGIARRHVERTK